MVVLSANALSTPTSRLLLPPLAPLPVPDDPPPALGGDIHRSTLSVLFLKKLAIMMTMATCLRVAFTSSGFMPALIHLS